MRLNQKKQILELMYTINEGLEFLCSQPSTISERIQQDCQDGLIVLSNLLSAEVEVSNLLDTAILSTSLCVEGEQINHANIREIIEILDKVRNIIIEDIKTDLEIAFFPYKASMWDSLDSIYREAEKDPNCSCYVVPIPYYERNSNGELVKFCYEGNNFPSDIDITLFEMYDFENRRPDIIYVHNPYDEYNALTMINPRYFSGNLKKYTDMLVYVPYYMAGSAETHAFSIMPAFNNVSAIIVQSETAREAYIESGVSPNKVYSLGTPKVDAMYHASNERYNIPLSWKVKLQNKKKVFLFNTGIADLLSTTVWLDQINQVLEYFHDNEQYALIWRPHPLTEVTLGTMRNHICNSFDLLKDKAINSNNIIIDYSTDVYPAVSVSDGLISDYSSVLLQYIVTGKPVLGIMNDNLTNPNRVYFTDYLGCYFVNQGDSLQQFVKMVVNNEDYKKENRLIRFNKSISNSKGNSGKKINDFIKEKVLRESLS